MSMNLKAITSVMGYEQISTLTSATKLTVPQRDQNGLVGTPRIAIITPEAQAVQ